MPHKKRFRMLRRVDETQTRNLAEQIAKRRKEMGFKTRITNIRRGTRGTFKFRISSSQRGTLIKRRKR